MHKHIFQRQLLFQRVILVCKYQPLNALMWHMRAVGLSQDSDLFAGSFSNQTFKAELTLGTEFKTDNDLCSRASTVKTIDERAWAEVMSKQGVRMLFQRSLFTGCLSNLPAASLFPGSSLQVVRRAKSGFLGGEPLAKPTDNNVKSESSLQNRKDRTGVHQVGLLERQKKKKEPFLPFSHFLTDLHGREHDYLRISISERWPTTAMSMLAMPMMSMIPAMLIMPMILNMTMNHWW